MEDSEDQKRLQELYDAVYEQARVWFQNLKVRFHNQILQHFGPMPEREADIQVGDGGQSEQLKLIGRKRMTFQNLSVVQDVY